MSLERLVSDNCEMEDWHRDILRSRQFNLEKDLEPKNILSKLTTVLNKNEEDQIRKQSERMERCQKLLEILPRKGPTAFKVFVVALRQEAPHLALDLIEAGNKEETNQLCIGSQGSKY